MNHLKSRIVNFHFGLKKPVRILHITDAHLCLADDVDGDEMKAHAARRRNVFFNEAGFPERDPVGYLKEAMEYSKKFDCTVFTGDVLDCMSHANRVAVKEILAGKDYLYCAGNHEFCPQVGVRDTLERKIEKRDEMQSLLRGNMHFESRVVGGVNLVCADNGYRNFYEDHLELFKKEAEKGLPILFFCHVPLGDDLKSTEGSYGVSRWVGTPEHVIEASCKAVTFLAEEPLVKAVFAGHGHSHALFDQFSGKPCYMTAGLFKGMVTEIVID